MRRLFFGIPLSFASHDFQSCQRHWQQLLQLTENHKPVHSDNFHLTLQFLGAIEEERLEVLHQIALKISGHPFELELNTYGLFTKAKCGWIGPTSIPNELYELHQNLTEQLSLNQFKITEQGYTPHVTLFRNIRLKPEIRLEPSYVIFASEFALFESVPTMHGVRYIPLNRYPLLNN